MSNAKFLNSYSINKPKKLDGIYKKKVTRCPFCQGTHHPAAGCPKRFLNVYGQRLLTKQTK